MKAPTLPHPRRLIAGVLAAGAVFGLAVPADAAPGRNGRIAFTSGREGANDNEARLHMVGPTTLPGVTPTVFTPLGGMHRHPSWSPDRTKVVYAVGTPTGNPATEEFDLLVKDLVNDTILPLDGTQLGDGLSSDHPAWSPDGTRIAYETQTVDNTVNREIMVKRVGTSEPALAVTASAQTELKPAWTADSKSLIYARQMAAPPASNFDLLREPADDSGSPVDVSVATKEDEYQPAVSPDGTKLCFTLQATAGDTSKADIVVAPLANPAQRTTISPDTTKGDINCTWSPDGRKIAYTNGVFNQGKLVVAASDGTTTIPLTIADDAGSNNFDGNADWGADGSPECPDTTVTTKADTPVTIPLECTDTGPAYERTDPNGFVSAQPQNGTLADETPLANPSTVRYTPKPGFTGTDSLGYGAFDDYGFGTDNGTVTIRVEAPPTGPGNGGTTDQPRNDDGGGVVTPPPPPVTCAGLTATIVGTPGNDRLAGTPGRDVIVAGAGSDVIRAGRGGDVVCAGSGRDSVQGGAGNDRLRGGSGRDRLAGGSGRDRLTGGSGRDRCDGGPGRDRAIRCETRKRVP